MTKEYYIKSGKDKVYVKIDFPKKLPAPGVIVAHGLRSYYPGFLNMFVKAFRDRGYATIVFHFVGTGKSSGKFENKTTSAMLQNWKDVMRFLKTVPELKGLGVVGRSNAGALAALYGPDAAVKVYAFLAPPGHYSLEMGKFIEGAKIKGKYFYHKSFKRPHTKGEGRLPMSYITELKKFDQPLIRGMGKMKPSILFWSTKDEASPMSEGHFDLWKNRLPQPKKVVVIEGGNHSFKGYKKYVIGEAIKWFKKYLPV